TGPIRFRMAMDLTAPALVTWARTIQLLLDDLDEPSGLTAAGTGGGPWSDFLMTGLLLAQPHSYSERLARGQTGAARPPSVRRAIDLVEREPAGDLSLRRLCAASGLGPRALQRNFREHVGVSPREYIQCVRLDRAHGDLAAGAGGTVAEIAFRWGFTHVPRFAGAYRDRYGVPPSATLRAGRSGGGTGTWSRSGSPGRSADRQRAPRRSSVVPYWTGGASGCPARSLSEVEPMAALSDETGTLKFVHTYGAGLHSGDARPDVHDPRWQQRQVEDFVEFAVLAEELGYDGITVTEHHAPLMTCQSPHLLLAAAAVRTSRIRLGTAVTVLPLYNPVRVAEEAGTLDLLSGGRFELGLGRGIPTEAQIASG